MAQHHSSHILSAQEREAYVRQLERMEEMEHSGEGGAEEVIHPQRHRQSPDEDAEPTTSVGAVHDRQSRWKERVTSATATLRQDLTDLHARECTFRPAINRRKSPASRHSARNDGVDVTVSECSDDEYGARPVATGGARASQQSSVFSRLHQQSEILRQRKEQAKEEKAHVEESKCSFRPRTVRSSWTENVQPRYLDPRSMSSQQSDPRDRSGSGVVLHGFSAIGARSGSSTVHHSHANDDDCTFAPVTNTAKSPFMAEYLRQPVHERLHQSPAATKKQPKHDASDRTISLRRALTPSQRRGFEDRLAQDIDRRRQRAQSRQKEAEMERPSFTPRTTHYGRLDNMSQEERDRLVEQRQQRLLEERQRLEAEMRPKPKARFVSPHSKKLLKDKPQLQRPLVDRFKETAARKAERLDAQRREREEAEIAELRSAPQNVARPPPDAQRPPTSELTKALAGDYQAYLHGLEKKRRKRLEETELEVADAQSAAQAECTFHPEVHDAPEYIRQIAQARSMSRHDTSHCGHHDAGRRHRSGSTTSASGIGPTSTGRMVMDPAPVRL